MKDYVHIVKHPFMPADLYSTVPEPQRSIMIKAAKCQNCEKPTCMLKTNLDIRGVMRRVSIGNIIGAKKLLQALPVDKKERSKMLAESQAKCVMALKKKNPVAIIDVVEYLQNLK
jgi:prolycopene isomerase